MENKISMWKFMTMTFTNVIFFVIALSLGFGCFGYGIYLLIIGGHLLNGCVAVIGSGLWLLGYRWRLRNDYGAYLEKLKNDENNKGVTS